MESLLQYLYLELIDCLWNKSLGFSHSLTNLLLDKMAALLQTFLNVFSWMKSFVFRFKLALVQVMAWRRAVDKPLPGPMLTQFTDAYIWHWGEMSYRRTGGRFKNAYELLNLRALKISMLYKNRTFQCMGKIFCVEFQRVPLKFHTKYLTHTLKDVDFIQRWKFKSS